MTTYIPKNPIPSLMDVNFHDFFVHKDGRPHSGHGSHGGHGGHGGHRGSERDRGDRDGGAPMSQLGGGTCRERFGPDEPAKPVEVLLKPEKSNQRSRCFRLSFLYNYHLFGIGGISLAKPTNNKQQSIEGSISVGVLDTIGVYFGRKNLRKYMI